MISYAVLCMFSRLSIPHHDTNRITSCCYVDSLLFEMRVTEVVSPANLTASLIELLSEVQSVDAESRGGERAHSLVEA